MRCDVAVVGASFAGLACARAAARAGASVVVLEKKPRVGARLHTTGIVVKEAVESQPWLREVPRDLVRRIEGVRLYAPNMRHVDLQAPGYFFWATDAPALLDWMVDSIRADGVDVRLGALFESAHPEGEGWRIPLVGGETLQSRYLVGADGPRSRVAVATGLSRNTQFLFGIEHEYGPLPLAEGFLHCFIDKRLAPGYIGWALAGVGVTQVGLARRTPPPDQAGGRRVEIDAFLRKVEPVVSVAGREPLAIRAGLIPCGGVLPRVAAPGVLLVGDAAGMVSPVTAGGIHTALRHGTEAGDAIARFVGGHGDDPAGWMPSRYPGFRAKRALRWLFDHAQSDWVFNAMLGTRAMRRAAELVYFHRKGGPAP